MHQRTLLVFLESFDRAFCHSSEVGLVTTSAPAGPGGAGEWFGGFAGVLYAGAPAAFGVVPAGAYGGLAGRPGGYTGFGLGGAAGWLPVVPAGVL